MQKNAKNYRNSKRKIIQKIYKNFKKCPKIPHKKFPVKKRHSHEKNPKTDHHIEGGPHSATNPGIGHFSREYRRRYGKSPSKEA